MELYEFCFIQELPAQILVKMLPECWTEFPGHHEVALITGKRLCHSLDGPPYEWSMPIRNTGVVHGSLC